jgi:hypothetical protein
MTLQSLGQWVLALAYPPVPRAGTPILYSKATMWALAAMAPARTQPMGAHTHDTHTRDLRC